MKEQCSLFHIFVNTPLKVFTLKNIELEMPITKLKSRIEIISGIPVEHQNLLLCNRVLAEECTASEAGIKNGCVVRLAFKKTIVEALCSMVLQDDLTGIFSTGVQWIDLSEASNDEERRRLISWNKNATQQAFITVCIASVNGMLQLVANLIKMSAFIVNQVSFAD